MGAPGDAKGNALAAWWAGKAETRAKLHAWWEGYEHAPGEKPAGDAPPPPPPRARTRRPPPAGKVLVKEAWPPERIKVAQMIWGDGFSFPGGDEYAVALARDLALGPQTRALDIGCGLGGGTRGIARTFGGAVEGWDLSPDLANEGHGLSCDAGMAVQAPIDFYAVDRTVFAEKRYGAALVRNVLSLMSDKEGLLRNLARGLMPGASVSIVEFCLGAPDAHGEALDAYRLGEATAPRLLTIKDLRARVEAAGFAVPAGADHTEAFVKTVLTGWARIDTLVKRGALDAKEGQALMGEAELWRRRLEALRSGDLRVCRMRAVRKI
ncbi:MAG: methyltransferase domain-containing protein [Tagaea sp.]